MKLKMTRNPFLTIINSDICDVEYTYQIENDVSIK